MTVQTTAGRASDEARPTYAINQIGAPDVTDALRRGFDDFAAKPSHVIFLVAIYPVIGLLLAALTIGYNVIPLLFPLMAGFTLVGPFAALGFYEISRRRAQGLDTSWSHAFDPLRSPALGSIAALGGILLAIFGLWLFAAMMIYRLTFGDAVPTAIGPFLTEVLTTPHGWALMLIGNLVGLCFAVAVLSLSVVSFPLILDRNADVGTAVRTSIRAVRENPRTMIVWGCIVTGMLALGTIPLFLGLAVALPVLGHATWHLYRRTVAN